jgi:uncharacterized protein YacL
MPHAIISGVIFLAGIGVTGAVGYLLRLTPEVIISLCVIAGILAGLVIYLTFVWRKTDPLRVIGGVAGFAVGALLAKLALSDFLYSLGIPAVSVLLYGLSMLVFSLVGAQLGALKLQELAGSRTAGHEKRQTLGVLDTSVIIDGRISDVCETGFLRGDMIIPQFVLHELQMIADSSDSTKRTRGRRGLDILNKIQKQSYNDIIIDETDYPEHKDVDQKLISLAKDRELAILTNDFNLNKVAEVHSVRVLNINQLANALKPIVLPGETMRVQILKEGKEHGQGVAYLDDGTMVVIDHGRKYLGKNMDVTVTSVLQTTAGRMIFGVIKS